jgi:hypothetical protein
MIRKGTAPAVDYAVEPSDDGRFKIVWKTAKAAPTDEAETETAEASADQPAAASSTETGSQPAPAATKLATTGAAPGPASEAEIAPYPTSAHRPRRGIERACTEKRMATRHPRVKPERRPAAGRTMTLAS